MPARQTKPLREAREAPGWTGGIPMEVGGLMCPIAVVARELGIPVVSGVTGAAADPGTVQIRTRNADG
ncbi:MAG: hypothetical protein GY723_18780 [bacterium]|nr:hypothetical protein [bacterium]MCP5068352.1 hypothetical protein [bacterium]